MAVRSAPCNRARDEVCVAVPLGLPLVVLTCKPFACIARSWAAVSACMFACMVRLFVLYNLPTLEFLDCTAISDEERQEAAVRGAFLHIVRPGDEVLQRQVVVVVRYCLLSVCICLRFLTTFTTRWGIITGPLSFKRHNLVIVGNFHVNWVCKAENNSISLETLVEVLLDRYSPTPYHYATSKIGHLPPVNCPPSPNPVKLPSRSLSRLFKAHTKLPVLSAYPHLTVMSISVARCEIRIRG